MSLWTPFLFILFYYNHGFNLSLCRQLLLTCVACSVVQLSFLGGIHWGFASAGYGGNAATAGVNAGRFVWSVVPSLLAWPAVCLPAPVGLGTIAGSLGLALAVVGLGRCRLTPR